MAQRRRFVAAAAVMAWAGLGSLSARSAHAQSRDPSGQDVATAQALFDEGKRLMEQGNFAEACPKLVESQRLDPAGGTRLAIAMCHEAEGRTATAWADYNLALADARRDKRPDRENAAATRVRALEQKLSKLRVVVANAAPGLEVLRDGAAVGQAQWGIPLPIDPGNHVVEARAPGRKPWREPVTVIGDAKLVEVHVPTLAEDASAGPPVTSPAPAAPPRSAASVATPPRDDRSSGPSSLVVLGAVVGGAGIVSLALGTGFGLSASAKWSDAEAACPRGRCTDRASLELGKDAGHAADLSTVFFVLGGVATIAGGALVLVGRSDDPSPRSASRARLHLAPMATLGGAGLSLGGTLR